MTNRNPALGSLASDLVRRLSFSFLVLAVFAVVIGLIVGGGVPARAASVDGSAISQTSLDDQLAAIDGSKSFGCYLAASEYVSSNGANQLTSPTGAIKDSTSTELAALWLNQRIDAQITHETLNAKGLLRLSQTALAQAESDLTQTMDSVLQQYQCGVASGSQLLNAIPKWFALQLITAQAEDEALLKSSKSTVLSAAAVQAYYAQHARDFDTYCVSGILVGTKAEAQDVATKLRQGLSFADAATQYSKDAASSAKGGQLGCFSPSDSNYGSVANLVKGLTVNVPAPPTSNGSNGYVILMVTSRTPTPEANAASIIESTLLRDEARRLINNATVSVNPRYGIWQQSTLVSHVVTPNAPSAQNLLNVRAILPGAEGY